MAAPIYVLAVLSIIYLHSTNGRSTDSLSPRYPAGKYPKTIDEVLMQASGRERTLGAAGVGSENIIDGLDMILSRDQYATLYGGPHERSLGGDKLVQLWPNGRIPYEIDYAKFNPERINRIKDGMTAWEVSTCVTFHPATYSDINKVQITSSSGCFAVLGMSKDREPQILSLNYQGCFYKGTVEHELGHAIGLVHEHQRPERVYHLQVYESNAMPNYRNQLQAYKQGSVDKMGLDYDYYSVMHYGKTAFSKDGVAPTMYAYDWRGQRYLPNVTEDLGKGLGPSFLDIKLVNLMYNCSASCRPMPTCGADCFVDKYCRCVCKDDLPPVHCENSMAYCEQWAQRGECWANRYYMEYFCRKSCKMCPTHGTIPPELPQVDMPCTEDTRTDCQVLADRGDCVTNRDSMIYDCRKTCTGCSGTTERPHTVVTARPSTGTTTCVDEDVNCPAWARANYCGYYPHIIPTCKKSCGACT